MKFNIKDYFNFKLYLHGLKRLRLTGLVSAICLCALSILCIGSEYTSTVINYDFSDLPNYYINAGESFYQLLLFVVYLIVPIMSFIIWNFLNHRNGSDFFHAVSSKRVAVFLSFFAAVVTWTLLILTSMTITITIMYIMFPSLYTVNLLSVFLLYINVFISCLLVAACFALGCSLTGTIFSNLTASVGILFVPRCIIAILCLLITTHNPLVEMWQLPLLTRYTNNLPASLLIYPFANLFSYDNAAGENFVSIGFPTFYTLVLAIIYIALGCVAYYKRSSESAGKSAASKKIQVIINTVIGYIISLIIVAIVYSIIIEIDYYLGEIHSMMQLVIICVMVLFFVVLSMFIYELITTKSIKAALKSLLRSPVIIILDALTVIALIVTQFCLLTITPQPDNTQYIKLPISSLSEFVNTFDGSTYINGGTSDVTYDFPKYEYIYDDYSYYYASRDYFAQKIANTKITDSESIKKVCNVLDSNAAAELNRHVIFGGNGDYSLSGYSIPVTFGNGLTETDRTLHMGNYTYKELLRTLLDANILSDAYSNLPDSDSPFVTFACEGLSSTQIKEIYDAYRQEIKALDTREFLSYQFFSYSANTIDVYINSGGVASIASLPLTPATPEALGLYLKYYNENHADEFFEAYDVLSNDTSGNVECTSIHLKLHCFAPDTNQENTGTSQYLYAYSEAENSAYATVDYALKFKNEMSNSALLNFDYSKYILCFVNMNIYDSSYYNYNTPVYKNLSYYFLIENNKETIDALREKFDESTSYNFYLSQ